ncbi:Hypothetical protein UVM_LOCUS126 [uncultured virus]|nr:Hypothetical protein UVM_LOCUS126 [uncultured virus]
MTSFSEPEPAFPTSGRESDIEQWQTRWIEWKRRSLRAKSIADRPRVAERLAYFSAYPCDVDRSEVVEKLSRVPSSEVLRIITSDAPSCVSTEWLRLVVRANGAVEFASRQQRKEDLMGRCARVRAAVTVVPIHLAYETVGPTRRQEPFALNPIGHAVALIVDHARLTAEFFNPWGSLHEQDEPIQALLATQLARDLPQYRMVRQEAFCPVLGPQGIEAGQSCASWSLLYAFLRVEEPELEPKDIFEEMLADATRAKLRRLIEGFACWVWAHPQIRVLGDSYELGPLVFQLRPEVHRINDEMRPEFVRDPTWRAQSERLLEIYDELQDAMKDAGEAAGVANIRTDGRGYGAAERSFAVARELLAALHDAMRDLAATERRLLQP